MSSYFHIRQEDHRIAVYVAEYYLYSKTGDLRFEALRSP